MSERTVQQALAVGARQLMQANIESAARDARVLMAFALDVPPERLTLHAQDPVERGAEAVFLSLIDQRAMRQPVSQIVGGRWFYGRWFKVTPDTLDPRPDTETLVEEALRQPFSKALDLGVGTGCIILTLLAERGGSTGAGVDVSRQALDVARENATALKLADRVKLTQSRWFEAVTGTFDLIVSNPPYISVEEMQEIEADVREHEPRIALCDEGDGLSNYRSICAQAPDFLKPGGRLLMEIGYRQGIDVADIFRDSGFENIDILPDIDGRDRLVSGYKSAE